ncbi:MAG: 2-C-methyl-D-erythritol 2,4-cyclodiphosphate synthase [Chloroflexi bacterium]|nr:2-C-methyl-D-erythritol 2,4-cyclodiphosphate synthase [Chloroflexota bacterium]
MGYDVHRLVAGRRLVLGGVTIPFDRGLEGHSDADVVVHAVMDALLGAAGLGDIGVHFPPTDEGYRGADSLALLRRVSELLSEPGWRPVNVDVMVVAEAPRLRPYVDAMRANVATALGLAVEVVSVKATTNERLGAMGRAEGISAQAVALIARDSSPGDATTQPTR